MPKSLWGFRNFIGVFNVRRPRMFFENLGRGFFRSSARCLKFSWVFLMNYDIFAGFRPGGFWNFLRGRVQPLAWRIFRKYRGVLPIFGLNGSKFLEILKPSSARGILKFFFEFIDPWPKDFPPVSWGFRNFCVVSDLRHLAAVRVRVRVRTCCFCRHRRRRRSPARRRRILRKRRRTRKSLIGWPRSGGPERRRMSEEIREKLLICRLIRAFSGNFYWFKVIQRWTLRKFTDFSVLIE